MITRRLSAALLAGAIAAPVSALPITAQAAEYVIDTEGQHAFIEWRINHLGFSWLYGRFNDFEGSFEYEDGAIEDASVEVTIDMASLDSNHAERDKHLREADFFHVKEYPEATFKSTGIESTDDGFVITGDLTMRGVTKEIEIEAEKIGEGEDPWGGYRAGFHGTTTLTLKDFGIDYDLGPAATTAEVTLSVEGVRQ
ncbi:YceI family protein [Guyparkeria hydrothermalis]|uniref:YceI family protein n=1 Tax=Guyparkeria hydrothermalis TaxID=923 RepID=UPI0020208CCD|nr:YceI family protein [Guyparkeria hydrothermalis]MCL7751867.1 YceI family protein [Guyparkeria hydrothermalis]